MKSKRPWLGGAALLVVAALFAGGELAGFAYGQRVVASWADLMRQMLVILPPVFVLLGLFEVWVPREAIERRVGKEAGASALLWMMALAMVQVGPLYVAFPVAHSLWRKGATPRNVFVYLGAFSAVKVPMLIFEVSFLGWAFSLTRTTITLPVFVVLAIVLEALLPKGYALPEVDGPSGHP